jgi:hypothetical protein
MVFIETLEFIVAVVAVVVVVLLLVDFIRQPLKMSSI